LHFKSFIGLILRYQSHKIFNWQRWRVISCVTTG